MLYIKLKLRLKAITYTYAGGGGGGGGGGGSLSGEQCGGSPRLVCQSFFIKILRFPIFCIVSIYPSGLNLKYMM